MRVFVVALCLCTLAVSAQQRRPTQAEDPCAGRERSQVMALDMDATLRTLAESSPAAAAEPSLHTATVDPVKLAAGMAWEEAASELLELALSIQSLTVEQHEQLEELERGKTAQQIFAGRLELLKMLTKR